MTSSNARFGHGDIVIGDWVWGDGMPVPHPVIQVTRRSVTVGVGRLTGGWGDTISLPWNDIHGVIPAVLDDSAPSLPADLEADLEEAAACVRNGFLDGHQRDALATLLTIAARSSLPTPIVVLVHDTIATLRSRNSAHHNRRDT